MPYNQTRRKIASKLRKYRLRMGLKQVDVAKKAKIYPNYYAKIERGEINTTIEKIEKIFKALGVKSSKILPF